MANFKFSDLREDARGASMVEFALIITLLFLIAFPSMQALGPAVSKSIQCTGDSVAGATRQGEEEDCLTANPEPTPPSCVDDDGNPC